MSAQTDHRDRVADNFPVDSMEWLVSLYHDHLEDGDKEPVPLHVLSHVALLTRRPGTTYMEYIDRMKNAGDPVAIAVKLADLADNIERCEGKHGGFVNSNLRNRYLHARKALSEAVSASVAS